MRITNIYVENFRGVNSFGMDDCPPTVLLLGNNRSGKTSIMDAIRATMTGRITDQTGKAIELAQWVGLHGKTASVRLGLDVDGEQIDLCLQVGKSASLSCDQLHGSARDIRAALWHKIGLSQKFGECGLTPRSFILGDDAGKMIADLGSSEVSLDALEKVLGEHANWFHQFTGEEGITPRSRDSLLAIGRAMYDARTVANARLKKLYADIEELANVTYPVGKTGKPLTLADIPKLTALVDQLKAARRTVAATADVSLLQEELDAIDVEALVAREQACVDALANADAALHAAQTKHAGAARDHANIVSGMKDVQRGIELGGECPICLTPITDAIRDRVAAAHKKSIEAMECAEREAKAACETALKEVESCHKTVSTARESLRLATADAAAAKAKASSLRQQINAAGAGVSAEDAATNEDRIAAASEALDTLTVILQRETMRRELDEVEAEAVHLAWGIPLFHDDGRANHAAALNDLFRDEREVFLTACNERLVRFGLRLDIVEGAKSLSFAISGTPLPQASGAETLISEWAVASAFCRKGIVLLDEFTRLDGSNRGVFMKDVLDAGCCAWFAAAYARGGTPSAQEIEAINHALNPIGAVWVG